MMGDRRSMKPPLPLPSPSLEGALSRTRERHEAAPVEQEAEEQFGEEKPTTPTDDERRSPQMRTSPLPDMGQLMPSTGLDLGVVERNSGRPEGDRDWNTASRSMPGRERNERRVNSITLSFGIRNPREISKFSRQIVERGCFRRA